MSVEKTEVSFSQKVRQELLNLGVKIAENRAGGEYSVFLAPTNGCALLIQAYLDGEDEVCYMPLNINYRDKQYCWKAGDASPTDVARAIRKDVNRRARTLERCRDSAAYPYYRANVRMSSASALDNNASVEVDVCLPPREAMQCYEELKAVVQCYQRKAVV